METAVRVPAADRHFRRSVPEWRRLHVSPANFVDARHRLPWFRMNISTCDAANAVDLARVSESIFS